MLQPEPPTEQPPEHSPLLELLLLLLRLAGRFVRPEKPGIEMFDPHRRLGTL